MIRDARARAGATKAARHHASCLQRSMLFSGLAGGRQQSPASPEEQYGSSLTFEQNKNIN
jgi:hypothetical protein